jgi:hypothetical protein
MLPNIFGGNGNTPGIACLGKKIVRFLMFSRALLVLFER